MGFLGFVKALLFGSAVVAVHSAALPNNVNPRLIKSDVADWTVNFVRKHGYKIETHEVTTEDNYTLTLHRIPSTTGNVGKPVLLHHGFLGSSADFVVLGPQNSLGFVLADQGFDVWIANARGSTNSRKHKTLNSTTDSRYWDFSWHEVGYYDLPAEIMYIIVKTCQQKLTYIGFSMGSTAFFVLSSTRPDFNDRVDQVIALGPVAFMDHVRGPALKYIAPLLSRIPWVTAIFGKGEFVPKNEWVSWAAQNFCENNRLAQYLCNNVLFLIYGYKDLMISNELVDRIFEYSPAGGSVRQFLHFGQLVISGQFREYDFGYFSNYMRYGQLSPPEYPIHKIRAPIHIFMGKDDWFAAPEDVQNLVIRLPNTPTVKRLERGTVNHFDFLYGSDIKEMCYEDVIRIIKED